MYTIDTDRLLDYVICPYRFTFNNRADILQSLSEIKSYIYSKLFDYALYLRASKQKVTLFKIRQRLNYLWNKVKSTSSFNLNISEKIAIYTKCNVITNMLSTINNVIYFELPRSIKIDDLEIMYNIYSFTQDKIVKSVVKFNRVHSSMTSSSSSLRILSTLVKEDIKELKDGLRHQIYLYRCDTAELYKTEYIPKKNIATFLSNISKGISNQIYFPRNEIINCKDCLWRTQCSWNNIND